MRHGRFIKTALVVVAAMAIGPAAAMATPGSFTDDSALQFAPGTSAGTGVVEPGSVQLKRTFVTEPFDGTTLPAGWTASSAGATVAGGKLTVEGTRVSTDPVYAPGQVLEFTATFSGAAFQHVGFADTFGTGEPWAIFSTGDGTGLRVRTTSGATEQVTPISIPGFDATQPHTYRIEWSSIDVTYYVDDAQVAVHTPGPAGSMRIAVSDFAADAMPVTVDSIRVAPFTSSGTFARVHDAGDSRVVWGTLTAAADTASGTALAIETRSGNTATPDDGTWSGYTTLGAGGAIQSPGARYIQYRATLNTGTQHITPSLNRVDITYDLDTTPTGGGQPGGSGAAATTQGSGNTTAVDKTKPKVTFVAKSLRASKKGAVSFSIGCPATEQSCKVIVKLKNGTKTVASKTVTVKGGKTKTVTLVLNKDARKLLAKRGSLKVSSAVTATDAAGNHRTTTKKLTLRRAAG